MCSSNFILFLLISFGITIPLFYYSTLQTFPALVGVLLLVGSYIPAIAARIATARDGGEARQGLSGWGVGGWIGLAAVFNIWIQVLVTQGEGEMLLVLVILLLAALSAYYYIRYGKELAVT